MEVLRTVSNEMLFLECPVIHDSCTVSTDKTECLRPDLTFFHFISFLFEKAAVMVEILAHLHLTMVEVLPVDSLTTAAVVLPPKELNGEAARMKARQVSPSSSGTLPPILPPRTSRAPSAASELSAMCTSPAITTRNNRAALPLSNTPLLKWRAMPSTRWTAS